jgi:hypothetical protein
MSLLIEKIGSEITRFEIINNNNIDKETKINLIE